MKVVPKNSICFVTHRCTPISGWKSKKPRRRRRCHRLGHPINGRLVYVFSQDFTVFRRLAVADATAEDLQNSGHGDPEWVAPVMRY